MEPTAQARVKPLYRGTQIVWYIVGIIQAFLGFRFILKLLGANPSAGFTDFVYTVTQPFASPFLNVFSIPRVEGSVLEWTTLLAMLVYFLIALAIIKLFVMGKPVTTSEAEVKLDQQN